MNSLLTNAKNYKIALSSAVSIALKKMFKNHRPPFLLTPRTKEEKVTYKYVIVFPLLKKNDIQCILRISLKTSRSTSYHLDPQPIQQELNHKFHSVMRFRIRAKFKAQKSGSKRVLQKQSKTNRKISLESQILRNFYTHKSNPNIKFLYKSNEPTMASLNLPTNATSYRTSVSSYPARSKD